MLEEGTEPFRLIRTVRMFEWTRAAVKPCCGLQLGVVPKQEQSRGTSLGCIDLGLGSAPDRWLLSRRRLSIGLTVLVWPCIIIVPEVAVLWLRYIREAGVTQPDEQVPNAHILPPSSCVFRAFSHKHTCTNARSRVRAHQYELVHGRTRACTYARTSLCTRAHTLVAGRAADVSASPRQLAER